MSDETDIKTMDVPQLKAALRKRNLSTEGAKSDLVNRLQARLDEEEFAIEETTPSANSTTTPTTAAGSSNATEATTSSSKAVADASTSPPKPKERVISTSKGSTADSSVISLGSANSLSFAEKKAARAKRFGLSADQSPSAKKRGRGNGPSGKNKDTVEQKRQKNDDSVKSAAETTELLSKEEIERRLARGKKFGTLSKSQEDELKGMLRIHRFNATA